MHTSLATKTMKSKFSILTSAIAATLLSLPLGTIAKEPEHADAPKVSPADALARLKAGNQRFVAGKLQHPHQDSKRRAELAKGQRPFAIVLGCADSRTSPEVLFDQGLGDLFVVRVAGNVLDDHALASVEYAVEHLGAQLIVVLGHQRCGAVQAAKETIDSNAEAPAHINSLVTAIKPAVEATRGADVEATVKANIDNVVEGLRSSEPVLKKEVETGAINVVGAYYNLDTATVSFTEKRKSSSFVEASKCELCWLRARAFAFSERRRWRLALSDLLPYRLLRPVLFETRLKLGAERLIGGQEGERF